MVESKALVDIELVYVKWLLNFRIVVSMHDQDLIIVDSQQLYKV